MRSGQEAGGARRIDLALRAPSMSKQISMESGLSSRLVRRKRHRMAKAGGAFPGVRAIRVGIERLWRKDLQTGGVTACRRIRFTTGEGIPFARWLDGNGAPQANDSELQPDDGRMWSGPPAAGFLVRADSCVTQKAARRT